MDTSIEEYISLKEQGEKALKDKNFELAKECFEKALAINTENPEAYNNLGKLYITKTEDVHSEDHSRGEEYYRKALEIDSDYFPATINLGQVYIEREQYEECIPFLKKAIELKPDEVKIYNYLGVAYKRLGQYSSAEEWYRKGLKVDPEHDWLQFNLAWVLGERHEMLEARTILSKLKDTAPSEMLPEIYYYLGLTYQTTEEYDQALFCFNKHIELNANDYRYQGYKRISEVYDQLQQDNEAIEALSKALEIYPYDPSDWCSLGIFYKNIENYPKAIECYLKSNETQENELAYYHLARVKILEEKNEEAVEYLNRAIALNQTSPQNYALLGLIYLELGNKEGALAAFAKTLEFENFCTTRFIGDYKNIALRLQYIGYEDLANQFFEAESRLNKKT